MKIFLKILQYCNWTGFLIITLSTIAIAWADNRNKLACNMTNTYKAIQTLHQAIKVNAINPLYYANLGLLYVRINAIDSALVQFQKAYVLNSNDAGFCFNLGLLYQLQKDNKKSLEFIERAKAMEEYNVLFLVYLGLFYENCGNIEKAKSLYAEAISCDPSILDSSFYSELKQRDSLLTTNILDQSYRNLLCSNLSEDPIQLAHLGKILEVKGNILIADSILKRSICLLPNLNRPYLYLGQIALLNKDSIKAKMYFEKAVLLDPYDMFALLYQSKMERSDNKKQVYHSSILYLLKYRASSRYDMNMGIYKTASLGRTEICPDIEKYIQPQIEKAHTIWDKDKMALPKSQ